MTERMRPEDHLRPELRTPDLRATSMGFLDLEAWRSRQVADLREATGEKHLTITDCNVLLHVFVFGLQGHGSRASEIIENLRIPRRTARDSLALWRRLEMICQERHHYHPTRKTAELFNGAFFDHFRLLASLCSHFTSYRGAIGR